MEWRRRMWGVVSSPRRVGAENRVVCEGHGDAMYVQMMKLAGGGHVK